MTTSDHAESKRPVSVTVVGCLFVAAGLFGLLYHATEFNTQGPLDYELLWVLLLRLLAMISGVFLIRGENWARWLALAWMAYHVVLSAFHSWAEAVIHLGLLAVFAYVLLRPKASQFFQGTRRDRETPMT